jgi:hypothetical protein
MNTEAGMDEEDQGSSDIGRLLRRYWWLTTGLFVIALIASYFLYRHTSTLSPADVGANGLVLGAWGLLVGAAGFPITIWQLARTQSATRAAAIAVDEVRSRVAAYDAVVEASRAAALIRETRRHIKVPAWDSTVTSYSQARDAVTRLVELPSKISAENRSELAIIIVDIGSVCDRIEAGLIKSKVSLDRGKLVKACREHEQIITKISIALQREIV